jgi:hypothetical protein
VSGVTSTPHDALFKAAFSKLHHARGLLRALLPERLGRRIVWSTLRAEKGLAVGDEALDEQRMDLVYSTRAGKRRVLIYVLAEHQSKVDPWMVFRVLCYMVAIWKGYCADHPRAKLLPAIVPIVVHHSATGWTAPVAFDELLDVDAELLDTLGPYLPRFRFLLDDVSKQTDADLRARTAMTPGGRLVILALKHGRAPVAIRVGALAPDGRALAVRDVLTSVVRYILETSRVEPAALRELLARQVGRKEAERMLTTAEKLRREGRAEGRAEGKIEGKRESLLYLLRERFGRLPRAVVARIEKTGTAELDLWFARVLTAASLGDVVGEVMEGAVPKATKPAPARARGTRQAAGGRVRSPATR